MRGKNSMSQEMRSKSFSDAVTISRRNLLTGGVAAAALAGGGAINIVSGTAAHAQAGAPDASSGSACARVGRRLRSNVCVQRAFGHSRALDAPSN